MRFGSPGYNSSQQKLLWPSFLLYMLIVGFTIWNHELWGDELHSWNIANASESLPELFKNISYEGHPPLWYILLWLITKISGNLIVMQFLQFTLASAVIYLLLFRSKIPILLRLLIPFGYFFLFEYGVLARNYAVGILPAFWICYLLKDNRKILLYYFLLLIMANTHLLALVLAGSLHIYFLLLGIETKKRVTDIFLHVIIGIFIFIPSLYFIFPPSDSSIATGIMQEGFGVQQLGLMSKIPLRVFLPIPAWWEPHFWNTQFLLEWQQGSPILKTLSLFLSVLTLVIAYYILKESKKALAVFLINLCLTLAIGVLFPLTTTRYIGFIFIGFVVAYWLYCNEGVPSGKNKILLSILLSFQIIAGLFAVVKDMVLPFSNASKVSTLYAKIPKNEKVVTDYWAVNTVSAFTNKKLYTLGINKEVSFLLWNEEMKVSAKSSYINSLNKLFDAENIMMIYLISGYPLERINELDPLFTEKFNVELVDKAEGSIEKWSDIYLYKISRR